MRGLFRLNDAKLPHPPIMEGVLSIAEKALREAWRQVYVEMESENIEPGDAYEDQLNAALWQRLNDIRIQEPPPIPGFTPDQFESVQRESNWRDCQNNSIDKQPDLVFKFYAKRPNVPFESAVYDGLFVECKPIDQKHSIKKHYLEKGLLRFVDGTYAWAMQDAMMLGYVRNSAIMGDDLIPLFSEPLIQNKLNLHNPPTPCSGDSVISDRCVTRHNRDCIYQNTGDNAGPIQVRHLWLVCK